jgi:hypothetical protein
VELQDFSFLLGRRKAHAAVLLIKRYDEVREHA